jgi:UDP-glucose:(heptosyl)LPS alpha-1,3-glucosyltransferase
MKIALIRRRYTPHGGAERYVENLSRRLVEKGHEVHIFSHSWPGSEGITIHPVTILPGVGLLKLWSFNYGVQRLLARESFNVVQSFEKTWCQDVYRAGEGCHKEWLLQRKKYEPFYKTMEVAVNPFHWLTLAMERKLFEKSNTRYFIANSQRGKKEILSHYRVPEKKIQVIYNAVSFNLPLHLRERVGVREENKKTLLFVGSGFLRKGLYFVIKALPLVLKKADVSLLVVGQGNQKKACRLAEKLGVLDKISIAGPIKEVAPYYRQADVFVLPSIYEPFSNACLEAMAYSLPIVTTDMNGASEDIISGDNGSLIKDPADIPTLSDAILQALKLNDEDVRPIHGRMLTRHTWDRHMEDLLAVYDSVLKEKNRSLNKSNLD